MKRLAVLFALSGCAAASTPSSKTIEPTATIEPPSPGAGDSTFVLSRKPVGQKPTEQFTVHVADQWWPFRAEFLKTSDSRARERDAEISEKQAPAEFWDQQTAVETIATWSMFCNECHGGRRRMDDALKMPSPTPNWGRGEGLFFGNRRPYAEIFRIIYNGKIEKEGNRYRMPAWRGKLSKEQIWSLIYFVEYQSGGIEGRFPPSLYPRGDSTDR